MINAEMIERLRGVLRRVITTDLFFKAGDGLDLLDVLDALETLAHGTLRGAMSYYVQGCPCQNCAAVRLARAILGEEGTE